MFNYVQPELFWAYLDRSDPASCWLWGGRSRRGREKQYGAYSVRLDRKRTKSFGAHRVAYALHHGLDELPFDAVIQHTCDTPLCCNPAHLLRGTNQSNADDMWSKGRGSTGDRAGRFKPTITDDQRAEVRRLRQRTNLSQKAIGREVGICQMSVSNILRGVA